MTVRLTSSHGSWALPNGPTVFGRSKSCDICLLDSRLSRRHAGFHVEHSRVMVEDLSSTNGVLINGARIVGRQELANGDQLVIGPCVITVIIDPTMRPSEVLRALTPGAPGEKSTGDETDIMNPVPPEISRGHGSPSRQLDPAIAAATGGKVDTDRLRPDDYRASSIDAVSPRRRSTTSTHRPSDLPVTNESALAAAHDLAATVADDQPLAAPPPTTPPSTQAPSPSGLASTANPFASATTVVAPVGRRLLAGLLDAFQAGAIALALAVPPLVIGYALGLHSAGGVVRDGLPRLSYTADQPATLLQLAATLLHSGGLTRAVQVAGELQQHYQRLPAVLLFAGVAVAVLAVVLTLLLLTVVATVLRGGPLWHRRLGLAIIDARTGGWPSWGRALSRWSLLLILWPLAVVAALLQRSGPHDHLSGCRVHSRPR